MKYQDTICHKVDALQKSLEQSIKDASLDVGLFAKNLAEIRTAATRMENGLKLRKEIMTANNLEADYQVKKGKENTPPGINTVRGTRRNDKTNDLKFKVTVEENGKIVYQTTNRGLVMSVVEKIDDIDEQGVITGQAQTLMIGHELVMFYAFDQLHKHFQREAAPIMAKLMEAVKTKAFANKDIVKKIIEAANQKI
jgi:hypothetical protein